MSRREAGSIALLAAAGAFIVFAGAYGCSYDARPAAFDAPQPASPRETALAALAAACPFGFKAELAANGTTYVRCSAVIGRGP